MDRIRWAMTSNEKRAEMNARRKEQYNSKKNEGPSVFFFSKSVI